MSFGGRVTREILDCYFNGSDITAPSNIYVSLHTADPGEDGQGSGEVSGGSYARQQTSPSDWGAASGSDPSTLSNTSAITFPEATASWGTITHVGFWTSLAGTDEADFIGATTLETPRSIASGETPFFPIGGLDVTAD